MSLGLIAATLGLIAMPLGLIALPLGLPKVSYGLTTSGDRIQKLRYLKYQVFLRFYKVLRRPRTARRRFDVENVLVSLCFIRYSGHSGDWMRPHWAKHRTSTNKARLLVLIVLIALISAISALISARTALISTISLLIRFCDVRRPHS